MPRILLALLAGLLLGGAFYGGLWWTVLRGVSSSRPAAWFLGSIVVRMALVATGFILVAREDWRRWLACMLGFLVARPVVAHMTRAHPKPAQSPAKDAHP